MLSQPMESNEQSDSDKESDIDKHILNDKEFKSYFKRIFSDKNFKKSMNERCTEQHDSTSYILLCEAIKNNDNSSATALMLHHCRPNSDPDPDKDIPLHLAVIAGNVDVVRSLLVTGARVSASFHDQREALHLICDRASSPSPNEEARLEIVKHLMRYGANVNATERSKGDTPLILAVRSDQPLLVRFLVDAGADKLHVNKEGKTAFHVAYSVNAPIDIVKLVYDKGLDIELKDATGYTVLSCAVGNLISCGYVSDCDLSEPLYKVLFLLNEGASVNSDLDDRSSRILHMICQNHAAYSAKIFLERGADVNAANADGRTALHFAAENQPREIVQLLLEHKADVRALTNAGQSVLHFAAANKHSKVLELLLHQGLDIDAKSNEDSFTPLFNAVWSMRYNNAKLLLDLQAKVNERIINQQIVLHTAVDQGYVALVELLLNYGSDIEVIDKYGNTPLTILVNQFDDGAEWWGFEANSSMELVQKALIRHIAKCQVTGQYVSEQSLGVMDHYLFCDYYAKCIDELERMRETELLDGVSYLDLLVEKRDRLLLFVRHKKFASNFMRMNIRKVFPVYCDSLQDVVDATLSHQRLARRSAENIVWIVRNVDPRWSQAHLPLLIVEHILRYLNTVDLKNLACVHRSEFRDESESSDF